MRLMIKKVLLRNDIQDVLFLSKTIQLPLFYFLAIVLICAPNLTQSQTISFKKNIKQCKTVACVETQLDSLLENTVKISIDSLADCTHEVGLKMYFLSRGHQNKSKILNKAILHTKNALKIKASNTTIDSLSLQKSLSNLGIFQRSGAYYMDAIETYTLLLSLSIKNAKTINAYRYLSDCYLNLGDYFEAKEILLQGIKFVPDEYKKGKYLANFHFELADCYANMGYDKYSTEILNHLALSEEKASQSEMRESDKKYLEIISTFLKGNLLLKTKKYCAALNPLHQSLDNTDPRDSINLAIAHNSLGYAYLKLRKYKKSKYHLNESIKFDNQYSPALENLGDYSITQNKYLDAIQLYKKAIAVNLKQTELPEQNKKLNIEDIQYAPNKYYILSHLIQEAIAWKKYSIYTNDTSLLINSLNTFQLADKLIDEIRKQTIEEKSKLFWQEKGHDLYVNAIELCHLLNKPKLAYYFMEKNKALLLLGRVASKKYACQIGIPSRLLERERKIKKEIQLLESNYLNSEENKISEIREHLIKIKIQLDNLQDSIFTLYPEYAKSIHKINILSYSDFIKYYVQKDKCVIHYILSDTMSYGLLTTNDESKLFPINNQEIVDSYIQKHLDYLRDPLNDNDVFDDFKKNAQSTLKALIPKNIYSEISDKSLIIIPDQRLQQLPFETLIETIEPIVYLIENNDIHYQYSISYNFTNNQIDRNAKNNFIGFAPQEFRSFNLSSLTQSANEVIEINDLYQGDIYLSEKADNITLLKNISEYNIIHLSTHASSEETSIPWIALHDQMIYLDEINTTKNQAQLITLSACNTSIGVYKNGEGAMSLARSFSYAGANSIISTLWATNDKSNKEIMVEFYRQMKEGSNKSNALQKAKIKYLNSNNGSAISPYYWGAPIIIGNNQNISSQANGISNLSLLLIIIFSIAILFIFYRILHYIRKDESDQTNTQ